MNKLPPRPRVTTPLETYKILLAANFKPAPFSRISSNPDALESAGVRKKYRDNGRRNKGNWDDVPSFQVPGSRMALLLAANKAKRDQG